MLPDSGTPPMGSNGGSNSSAPAEDLLDLARAEVERLYVPERHQIVAALRAEDGRTFLGVHIEAMVGRASICAEAVALGNAVLAGSPALVEGVAIRHPNPHRPADQWRIVPPCGLCRELLLDYAPELRVRVPDASELGSLVSLASLLPAKYVGTKWLTT